MSGSYAVGSNYLAFTVGGAGAAGTGAFTIAALVQPAVGNNNAGFVGLYASSTDTRAVFEDSNHLFGVNDFSDGFSTLTQGTWYLVGICKPSGSAPWRFHVWAYASDGSGSFSHGTSTGSSNQGDGSTITEIRLGANEVSSNGLIAVTAVWTRELSDAEFDSMKSGSLTSWRDVSGGAPAELISLENWNGTSGATIPIGTSAYSSTTGTVSSGSNPPGFNFSLAAAGITATPLIGPGRSGPGGRWTLPPLDFSTASVVSAAAENATATGAAFDATVAVTANAETTTGTGAANDAQAAITSNAENTAGTGTANAATVDLQVNAGNASATGAANDGQAAITVNAEATTATGAAFDATVSTEANTSANAENAAGTGAANAATVALAPSAEPAAATGSAFDATVSITVNAESTAATGSALDAVGGVGAQADVAAATGDAFVTALAIQANAEAAAALGAALAPTIGGTTIKATSTAAVTDRRTSADAVTGRRTSSGGVG